MSDTKAAKPKYEVHNKKCLDGLSKCTPALAGRVDIQGEM
jgi:hypothetical protein